MVCVSLRSEELGLCRPIKKHSFHSWRGVSEGRRCQSPERSGAAGRGSEHGAGLVYAPRRAAQAGLTGGAERSSRLRWETNVPKKGQPKAELKGEELASSRHFSAVTPVLKKRIDDSKEVLSTTLFDTFFEKPVVRQQHYSAPLCKKMPPLLESYLQPSGI